MTTVLTLNDENQVSMNLENKENISNQELLPPDYQQVNHSHYEKEQDANQESNQGRDQRKATGRLYWCCGDRKVPMTKRRYLGGRMRFCSFISLMSCLTIFLILILLLPITYAVIVPQTIQQKFNSFVSTDGSGSGESLSFSSSPTQAPLSIIDVLLKKPIVLNLTINFGVSAQTSLPGTFTLNGPTTFDFGFTESVSPSAGTLVIPADLSFPINQAANASLSGTLTITDVSSVLANLKSTVYIKSGWKIKLWGIQWSNIPVSSKTSLNSKTGNQIFNIALNQTST